MTAYTAPLLLPVEYVQPGWQVEVRGPDGPLYADVVQVLECEEPDHPDLCATIIQYQAGTETHYSALSELTVRIPAEPTTPAGPADDERVYVTTARAGIPMHQIQPSNPDSTACGRATRTGSTLLARDARTWWESEPCPRCWRGAAS